MRKYRLMSQAEMEGAMGGMSELFPLMREQAQYDNGGNFEVNGREMYLAMATDIRKKFVIAYRLSPEEEMIDGIIYREGLLFDFAEARRYFLMRIDD